MSGIYIPNMEMPKCKDCFWAFGYKFKCSCSSEQANHDTGTRPDDCPLIPVPDHGRLIDADALRASIKESIDECHKWVDEVSEGEMYARVSQALGTFVECSLRVKAAPTIIPADGKDGAE